MTIDIAIIGGGPASVSFCLQLNKALNALKTPAKVNIFLFEKHSDIGFGTPYALAEEAFCINLPKDYMALMPGEYHHFSSWLKKTHPLDSIFPPRHYFGQYAKERFYDIHNEKLTISSCVEHQVLDIAPLGNNEYQIQTRHQHIDVTYRVNCVILATGHLPSTAFLHLHDSPGFQSNPWDIKMYQTIPSHYHVGIIGSRLTAIDVALKLQRQHHQGNITMVSRSGLLSAVRGEHPTPKMKYLTPARVQTLLQQNNKSTRLQALIRLFEQEITPYLPPSFDLMRMMRFLKYLPAAKRLQYEIAQAKSKKTAWQSVLSCFYQIVFRIWPYLHLSEQHYFLKYYNGFMMTFLCSFPLDKASTLQSMMQTQQLAVYKGLMDIKKPTSQFALLLNKGDTIRCDHLILATGSGNNPDGSTLLSNLLKRGMLKKYPLGGICINPHTFQVLTKNQEALPGVYALGELVKGACFKTIELGQVVEQAGRICQEIIHLLDRKGKP